MHPTLPRTPFLLLLLLGLAAPFSLRSVAQPALPPAEKVEQLLAIANAGKPPVLWFASDPTFNRGSGPAAWSAQSGGRFAVRDTDAWGRPSSAFGLAREAKGGVAISGSTTQNPIQALSGSVLLFFRPGVNSAAPFLLFSRSDWGKPQYLSLRVNDVAGRLELTLAVADSRQSSRATQANLATVKPGVWAFAVLTWEQVNGLCRFRSWAGDLSSGELTEAVLDVPTIDPAPAIFMLGGRRAEDVANFGTVPLLFTDGLFCHFAIYDRALSADTVQSLYLAASRR